MMNNRLGDCDIIGSTQPERKIDINNAEANMVAMHQRLAAKKTEQILIQFIPMLQIRRLCTLSVAHELFDDFVIRFGHIFSKF